MNRLKEVILAFLFLIANAAGILLFFGAMSRLIEWSPPYGALIFTSLVFLFIAATISKPPEKPGRRGPRG